MQYANLNSENAVYVHFLFSPFDNDAIYPRESGKDFTFKQQAPKHEIHSVNSELKEL